MVSEVVLTDVTDVVVSDNPESATLPRTDQFDFAAHICDTMLIFEVVGDGTTVDRFQTFPAPGIRVKA